MQINVYDSKNPDRHLGWFDSDYLGPVQSSRIEIVVPPDLATVFRDMDQLTKIAEQTVERVSFKIGQATSEGGWVRTLFLHTDAPLDRLMRLKHFRLPGETRAAAERRRYYA